MNVVLAFLLASGIAYYWCLLLPNPTIRGIGRTTERILLSIMGTSILSLVALSKFGVFDAWWAWMILGTFYVLAALLSYLGYNKWNVLWRKDLSVSDGPQMCMFWWNLGIAVAAFTMI